MNSKCPGKIAEISLSTFLRATSALRLTVMIFPGCRESSFPTSSRCTSRKSPAGSVSKLKSPTTERAERAPLAPRAAAHKTAIK